jgi:hypothetical protein
VEELHLVVNIWYTIDWRSRMKVTSVACTDMNFEKANLFRLLAETLFVVLEITYRNSSFFTGETYK